MISVMRDVIAVLLSGLHGELIPMAIPVQLPQQTSVDTRETKTRVSPQPRAPAVMSENRLPPAPVQLLPSSLVRS